MMLKGRHIKKRYVIGVLAVLVLLVRCSSGSNDYDQPSQPKPISLTQYQQNDGYQDVSRSDPGAVQFNGQPQAAQPIIINNQPAPQSDSGFWHGVFAAHMFHSMAGGGHSSSTSTRRTVINKTYTTNHYHAAPAPAAAPVAVRPRPLSTSYSTPPKRTMTQMNGYTKASSYRASAYRPMARRSSFRSRH